MKKLILHFIFIGMNFAGFAQWQQTGPYGGTIYSITGVGNKLIAVMEDGIYTHTQGATGWQRSNGPDGEVYYMLTAGTKVYASDFQDNNVYESLDSGVTWRIINSHHTCYGMAFNNTTLFLATTDSGMLVSQDSGATWRVSNGNITDPRFYAVAAITESSFTTNVFTGGYYTGIYESVDNGVTWYASDSSTNPDLQYTSVEGFAVYGNTIVAATSNGVFISYDLGQSWVQDTLGTPPTTAYRIAMYGDKLLVGNGEGLFEASISGGAWTTIDVPNQNIQSLYVTGDTIYAGTYYGIFMSDNNGASWLEMDSGLEPPKVYSLQVSGNEITAGTAYGVSFSPDTGRTWMNLDSGMISTGFAMNFKAVYKSGNVMLGYDQINSSYRSTDAGRSWTPVNSVYALQFLPVGNLLFAAGPNGLYSSADTGTTWQQYDSTDVNALATDGHTIYGISSHSVFQSTDLGHTWVQEADGGLNSLTLTGIVWSTSGLYVFASDSLLYRSVDNGAYWIPVPLSGLALPIYTYTVNGNMIIVDANNGIGGISTSINNGISWQTLGGPPQSGSIFNFAIEGNKLFAGTQNGLYIYNNLPASPADTTCSARFTLYTDTNAANTYYALNQATGTGALTYLWNWGDGSAIDTGTTPSHIYADSGYYNICLTIADTTGCISNYCDTGTYLRSVQSLMIYVNVVDSLPTSTGISQIEKGNSVSIYPNPSVNSWQLAVDNNLVGSTLAVYDDEGRLVFQSEIKNLKSKIDLDVAKGVYWLRISSDKVSIVRKLVKM